MVKKSFQKALSIFPVLFLLNGSVVSAVEKVLVSPSSLTLEKGKSKNLTLTGKNLSTAKSAGVFQKNSPKNQFTAKVTCKGATRCVVGLTLKAQVAAGGYSVKLFDAKKQPVAEGQFKLTSPSGKTAPKSGQALRSKPKQVLPKGKTIPRSGRDLRAKPKQAPQAGKLLPRSSQSLRAKPKRTPPSVAKAVPVPRRGLKPRPKQSPPTSKILPRSGQSLRAKSRQVLPKGKTIPRSGQSLRAKSRQAPQQSTKSLIPGRTGVNPSGLAELAGITLASGKRGFGEMMKGTVTLKEKAPVPNGVRVTLSSSNRRIATVSPVLQIPAGKNKADFSLKTGQSPGAVKISAKLGKFTLITSLVVEAPETGNINSEAREMTGRRGESAGTTPATLAFKPVIINPGKIQVTGRRPIPFRPVIINPGKIQVTGIRPIPFRPVIINPGKMQVTGRRGERAQIR